jgi:methylthioribose-1-phosphate isomerase
MGFDTLRWNNGVLELLDQTKLPDHVVYVACNDSHDVIRAIRTMVVRGAPAIGVAAAYGVALAAKELAGEANSVAFNDALATACDEVSQARPTAVNLAWAVNRMREVHRANSAGGPHAVAESLLREAIQMHRRDVESNEAIGRHGAALVPRAARILTHCNAGALATAGFGTALGVIRAAFSVDPSITVIADETRPLLQGARLTAWELIADGIPTTLITDNMSGFLMAKGEIDLVVVGADRVAANGDVANKIGTYMVAVLAARHRIPFYVACPWSTVDMATARGDEIVVEERSPDEVMGFGSTKWAPRGVGVRNPAFDVTPAELVTALITDRGIVRHPSRETLSILAQRD